MNVQAETAESRYQALETHRTPYLTVARDAAKMTIPALLPPSDDVKTRRLPTPWQGTGARGVNNLASKLLLTLFPPNTPFARYVPEPGIVEELQTEGLEDAKSEIEKTLGTLERRLQTKVETRGDRVKMFETLKQLLVTGNALLFLGKDGNRVFKMDKYVVKRSPNGDVLEIVVREGISLSSLDPKFVKQVQTQSGVPTDDEKSTFMFTHIKRNFSTEKFDIYQEIKGIRVPGSDGSYPIDKTPWLVLRYSHIDGEDYGRGFIEEYYGDLNSLERLTKAIVEGAAAAAKVLFLVSPNGTTTARTLQQAPNGAVRSGDAKDISVLQLDKFADFRVTLDSMERIESRLSYAFMLNSSVQRKGERVTAEEIRYMATELEDALGGVYSILSLELQLPYVRRLMVIMEKDGSMPSLPKDMVSPTIVTGLEALGRGHDLRKLDDFMRGLAESVGPEVLAQFVNMADYIKRRATAVGIDTEGLIKTPEQLAAERAEAQQQQQQQMMIEKLGPNAVTQLGAMAKEGMNPNAQQ